VIVLDTHIFIWYALDDPLLDRRLKNQMDLDPTKILLPTICLWEAMLLAEKGRIVIQGGAPGAILRRYLELSGFIEAPLTGEIAVLSRTLKFDHDDPADRFIAATAYAHGAELATSDARLRSLAWVKLAY